MRNNRLYLSVMLLFLGALPLLASDQAAVTRGTPERRGGAWVERARLHALVKEGGRLVLRTDSGSILVRTGAPDRMEGVVLLRVYTANEEEARRVLARYQLGVRTMENGGVYVTLQSPGEGHHSKSAGAAFNLQVPQRFNLDVQTQGGDISVENPLQGEVRLTTAGGDVRTADVNGPVRVETAGGSISLGNVGGSCDARTAGGNIHVGEVGGAARLETSGGEIVTGHVTGALRAETVGGDLVIGGADGQVVAQTAGGQIQIGQSLGGVRAETAGGSIRCQGVRGHLVAQTAGGSIDLLQLDGPVNASTAAGRILAQWMGNMKSFDASQLQSAMGDVYVYLPVSVPLTIDATIDAAAGHRIISDFPLNIKGEQGDFSPQTVTGYGALNGGGQVLRIRTVTGNIEIRKLDAKALADLQAREADTWQRWRQRWQEKEQKQREREQERRARHKAHEEGQDEEN
jgi:DUF4097 and DUF4098 domain-containing protein YvlB